MITERLYDVDLVEWQLIVSGGGQLPLDQELDKERASTQLHIIELRVVR